MYDTKIEGGNLIKTHKKMSLTGHKTELDDKKITSFQK